MGWKVEKRVKSGGVGEEVGGWLSERRGGAGGEKEGWRRAAPAFGSLAVVGRDGSGGEDLVGYSKGK